MGPEKKSFGDGCTIILMNIMALSCTFKNGKDAKCYV